MFSFFKNKKQTSSNNDRHQLTIQEGFKQNLEYISQTEIEPENIERQFVKSETRYFLTVGEIDCPTGKIIVSDPLCYLYANKMCPQLSIDIPIGTYPVEVALFRNNHLGVRMCTARLKIKDSKAIKYVCAEPTADSAVSICSDGVMSGFPVDAGMVSFCDVLVANEYQEFLNLWYKDNKDKNHYDDYFSHFFTESANAFPAYQREGGDFIEWINPNSGNKMVMIASGFGDGFYQCFWGYDCNNEICELIIPMINPDLFDF